MADEERREPENLGQDPYVERLRPDPSQPPEPVRILEGLLGDSDREGYKRLYFTRELDHYAEFRTEDVVFREPIPSEQPPMVGLDATRVGIRRDAPIEYTRVRAPRPVDEFDLDVRLGGAPTRRPATTIDTCFGFTCGGEQTCANTCQNTCQNTCVGFTCEGQQTCGGTCVGGTCDIFTCEAFGTCDLRCFSAIGGQC